MHAIRLLIVMLLGLSLMGVPTSAQAETAVSTRTLELMAVKNRTLWDMQVWRGTHQERGSSGIALAAGAVFEARVTNGVPNIGVDLMTDDSRADVPSIHNDYWTVQAGHLLPANGEWKRFTATVPSAAFFRLRSIGLNYGNTESPVPATVEFRVVSGTHYDMPTYRYGDDQSAFLDTWAASRSPFAVIDDANVTILLPEGDRGKLGTMPTWSSFDTIDEALDSYRHMTATYDSWLGLDGPDATGPHRNSPTRMFIRPDRNGSGAAYFWGWNYLGTSTASVLWYLQGPTEWMILHEIGHGYDGQMTRAQGEGDFALGEVWNNIYAYHYQVQHDGITAANWLYEREGKQARQLRWDTQRLAQGKLPLDPGDYRARLGVMVRIADLARGMEGFRQFNRTVRELHADGENVRGQRRTDLIAEHWAEAQGYNVVPWLEAHAFQLSPAKRAELIAGRGQMAMPVRDFFATEADAVRAAATLREDSAGNLVTASQLSPLGRTAAATVTATVANPGILEGREVTLWDGSRQVASAPFIDGVATVNASIGTYRIEFPADCTGGNPAPSPEWTLLGQRSVAQHTVTYSSTATTCPDDAAPAITTVAAQDGEVGTALTIQVDATDDSTPLSYAAIGLPRGLTVDAATGLISGTPLTDGEFTVTVTVTDAVGNSAEVAFTLTVTKKPAPPVVEPPAEPTRDPEPRPTPTPTPTPTPAKYVRTAPYTLPGEHVVGDRDWRTSCEPYSGTERCRTEIWATVVNRSGGTYSITRGWAFNNLTYLPYMTRQQWSKNPLGFTTRWTGTDGATWRTECDTANTGRNACRSYRMTTVYAAAPRPTGGYTFSQSNTWVFNNIVMFGSAALR